MTLQDYDGIFKTCTIGTASLQQLPCYSISIHPINWQYMTQNPTRTTNIILQKRYKISTESQCDINFMLCTPCCFHPTTSLKCPPASIPIVTHCHTYLSQYLNLCHPQCLSGLLCNFHVFGTRLLLPECSTAAVVAHYDN
jgi:hypothetical protein